MRSMGESMQPRRKRDRVVAEITVAHVIKLMQEHGKPLDQQQALDFLNEKGRAHAMWTSMMYAGENYIKSKLAQPSRPGPNTLKSDPLVNPGIPAFGNGPSGEKNSRTPSGSNFEPRVF